MRPSPTPPGLFPASLLPDHRLLHRLVLDPIHRLTPATPWAPLTDAEWAALAPLLAECGCGQEGGPGRPMATTPRARLDAIFRACTLKRAGGRAPWRDLPESFGKPDTASRSHRRWARAGLWARLLVAIALPGHPKVLDNLAHRICCAFRRAIRLMGLPGIMLAKRLRLPSALPAPAAWLPDEDLSEIYMGALRRLLESLRLRLWRPQPHVFRLLRQGLSLAGGRARIPRWAEPA